MQKLINTIALLSGLVSLSVLGGGVYVYTQKDALLDGVQQKIVDAAVAGVAGALPGMLDVPIPEVPNAPKAPKADFVPGF